LQVDVSGELIGIGDVSSGFDDVGEARSRRRQAGLDFLADFLQLRPHVALADDLAALVARRLRADDGHSAAIASRDDGRGR
jgi:hypothetical protein